LNISEIVAQKHLLARITALEIAVAKLEKAQTPEYASACDSWPSLKPLVEAVKRKPGRPRKNA
jgi:hypothetical protein